MSESVGNGENADAVRIKEEILRETGTKIPLDISLEAALKPTSDPSREMPPADPGDEDPSRDIPSAEVAMTFDGRSNHGSANLAPFTARRFVEIAKRQTEAEQKDKGPGSEG
jgi:hypothetical protein